MTGMDLSPIDDIITRLRALRLTAKVAGIDDSLFGRLFTEDLPRLEALRERLAVRLGDDEAERRRLERSQRF